MAWVKKTSDWHVPYLLDFSATMKLQKPWSTTINNEQERHCLKIKDTPNTSQNTQKSWLKYGCLAPTVPGLSSTLLPHASCYSWFTFRLKIRNLGLQPVLPHTEFSVSACLCGFVLVCFYNYSKPSLIESELIFFIFCFFLKRCLVSFCTHS